MGRGPAGLTAAWELLSRSEIAVTVVEMTAEIGGLAGTVNYKGNRIDIGGHRFFSKSDRVMSWWLDVLPLQSTASARPVIAYHGRRREVESRVGGGDPERNDQVFLLRQRRSRIYYLRRFFNSPVTLSLDTLAKLGPLRSLRIGLSYLRSALFPIRPEESLEEFFINRFGRELYLTFFKSYTEKVWGVPCDRISAEWGAQRVKGLSLRKALFHALSTPFRSRDLAQKGTETSLIDQFLYPKFGPGQMWHEGGGPAPVLQQLGALHGGRPRRGGGRARVLLQRDRRAVAPLRWRPPGPCGRRAGEARDDRGGGRAGWGGDPAPQDLPRLLRDLPALLGAPPLPRRVREPLPRRPERHAQVQQPGPRDADRHDRGRWHPRRIHRQIGGVGGPHRGRLPRGTGQRP